MAGRKQHYIPQAVQRAFEAARTGTKSQVLVFRKGRAPYLTSTEGAAAERDFYSNPLIDGKGALDDKITDFENQHLTPMLRELRSAGNGNVDQEIAAVTVAHLAFRTDHVRGSMAAMAGIALGQMQSIFEDPAAVRLFSEIDSPSENSRMAEAVRTELSQLGLDHWSEKDRKALERIVIFRLRERFDDLFALGSDTMRGLLDILAQKLPSSIAKAHARALSEAMVPPERVRAMRELNWRVIAADTEERHFILPDCVVAASSNETGEIQPFAMLSLAEAAFVIMPLSSDKLLVGSAGAIELELDEINRKLARCSLDFFISSRLDEATKSLAESIGLCSAKLAVSLLDEDNETPTDVAAPLVPRGGGLVINTPVGKFGRAAQKALSTIIDEVAEPLTIARVESVVVPANMSAALEAVWKRPPTTDEVRAAALGVVEPVKVDNHWRCRVIVPRSVVELLTQSSNSEGRLAAIRVVRLNLGRAYYFDCWARRCPEVFDKPRKDLWSELELRVAFRAASAYFGGLASVRHNSEPLPDEDNLRELAAILRVAFSSLHSARQQFFAHRNLDRLILEATQTIEAILVHTASVFGFLEAKNRSISLESEAGVTLVNAGLWEWGILFAKDLRRHYERRTRWASESELRQIGGHVERQLWTIGVLVSKVDGGHWIDVLDEERMPIIERILSA